MLFHFLLSFATLILMTELSSVEKNLTSHNDYFLHSLLEKKKAHPAMVNNLAFFHSLFESNQILD